MAFLEKIMVSLFMALGKQLVSLGRLKVEEYERVQGYLSRAKEYQEKISKPGETLEDRLDASDDFMR